MSKDAYGNPNTPTTGTDVDTDYGSAVVDRTVRIYPTTTARDSAIASPDEGQMCYITGDDELQVYDGTAWVEVITESGVTMTGALTAYAASTAFSSPGVRNIYITYSGHADWDSGSSAPYSSVGDTGDLLMFLTAGNALNWWYKHASSGWIELSNA